LEGADEELQQEAAAKLPGREREGSGDEDRTPNKARDLRRDGRGAETRASVRIGWSALAALSTPANLALKEEGLPRLMQCPVPPVIAVRRVSDSSLLLGARFRN
jgi:hypothetical protein